MDWLNHNTSIILVVVVVLWIVFNRSGSARAQTMLKKMEDTARRGEEQNRHLYRIATALEARKK